MIRKLLLFVFVAVSAATFAQRNCSSMEVLERLQKEDPFLQSRMAEIEAFTQNYTLVQTEAVAGVITIPVVVHVVYNGSTQNISAAQINSQIAVLNDDFRRMNADAANTPNDFVGVATDVEIQFCLASVDPSGNPTSGITRTSTTVSSFGTNDAVKTSSTGGVNAWPSSSYLNIWVCNIGGGILGYAQFPGGPASTDGVVCGYQYFGTTGTAVSPFNLGRTATHEVGHWLNLRHIWGDGGCSFDDFVNDTPLAGGPNYTGSPCTYPGPNSCGGKGRNSANDLPDMFQNYMDYSDDGCMNLFTDGQKSRMRALFDVGGARASLLSSFACGGTPPAPTCTDGIQNGNETGVDCGGPDCPACPPPAPCADPTGLSSSPQKGGREAVLSWNASSGAISYNVGLQQQGASGWSTGTTTGTSISATGLTKNATYNWYVIANCSGNSTSNQVNGTFVAGYAARAQHFGDIVLFPNPSNGMVTIDFSADVNTEASISVLNMAGSILAQEQFEAAEGNNSHSLDLSELPVGVYIVNLRVGDENVNLRLLKN